MKFSSQAVGTLTAAFSIAASACTGSTTYIEFTAPTAQPFHAAGVIHDDGCFLPPPGAACRPLADVRVEVMGGKEAGRVATSGPDGRFDLGMLSAEPVVCFFVTCTGGTNIQITASRPGWVSASEFVSPGGRSQATIRMGDEPHVFWGWVNLPPSMIPRPIPQPRAAGARVEIIDGPNAGKVAFTNSDGLYVFNDMVSSPKFQIEASKEGYQSVKVVHVFGLKTNGQATNAVLVAK